MSADTPPPDGNSAELAKVISGERERSHQEILVNAARAAAGYASLGVGENDAIATFVRNDFAFFEAAFAAAGIGAYAVPINWHYTVEETQYILNDCDAKVLVIHADLLPRVAAGIPPSVAVKVVDTPPEIQAAYGISQQAAGSPEGHDRWNDWIAGFAPWTAPAPTERGNMIYTSGTTGHPKGVRRAPASPEQQARTIEVVKTIFGIAPGQPFRTVITGPVYHSAPNYYALSAVQAGGLTILQPRFDPEQLLQMIEKHRITHLHMVPIMFIRLLRLPDQVKAKYDLSSLENVVHAAAPCPADVKRRMIEWWGPVINEYYGSTETGGTVYLTSEQALRKPGSVGKPFDGTILKILDAHGKDLGPNQIGEVFTRNEKWPDFTYNKKEEKRRECERNGLITAGDIGYVDEDGFLFLCDRANDMIISGGVNIYPAEIEAVLLAMPGVKDCAVFGIPDDEHGERVCAYIEPDDGITISSGDVLAYLGRHQASYKMPRVIEFRKNLPREDSGKIFKRKLRAPYWEGTGRRI